MSSPTWTAGYVSDVAYTLGFYHEMAPPMLDYALVSAGMAGLGASLSYCELGCGRGYGTALLAAANPGDRFVGIDFNPGHISEARGLAERAGLDNVTFLEASFAEAAQSPAPELERFDVVAMHGVYSWVSAEIREDIHRFLRARLAPGGVVYASYNTYPGWAASAPVREMLKAIADRAPGDSLQKVVAARAVLQTLAASPMGFVVQTPAARQRIEQIEKQTPAYVAHEFLNGSWDPLYVTEVMAALGEAKLSYAASANIAENRLSLCVPTALSQLVQSAADVPMRELLKDFAVNKQFRRDIYVKGGQRLEGRQARQRLDDVMLMVVNPDLRGNAEWQVPAGTARLRKEGAEAIFAALEQGPAPIGAMRAAVAAAGVPEAELELMLDVLVHNGALRPCRRDHASVDRGPALRLNRQVLELAQTDDTHRYLAAVVLGSAISTSYLDRLAMPLVTEDGLDAETASAQLTSRLDAVGKSLMSEGKPMAASPETSARLTGILQSMRDSTAPRWRAVGVLS